MTAVWAVIAGGGTSGHVHPALAIANELVRRGRTKDAIHFIGSSRGLEAELVPEHGYALTALPGRGIQRAINLQNITSAAQLGVAGVKALATLRKLKPAVVVSVGGYASLPAIVAAAALKIPIVVTEQNSVPGAANRFGSRWAKACAVAFPRTDLPNAVHTGNPLLGPILEVQRSHGGDFARERLGIEVGRRLIVAFGGSLGARRINEAIIEASAGLHDRSDLAIRHIIGDRDWPLFKDHVVEGVLQYQTVRYEKKMQDVWQGADLVVCRAGATSVAEIAQTGTPCILVPLPGAPGDHQTLNARALSDNDGAVLVEDHALTGPRLLDLINELIDNPTRLAEISNNAASLARPAAASAIADLVEMHARER